MKRKILLTLLAVVGSGILVSSAWIGITHATDARSGDVVTLGSSETTNNTLFATGNDVIIKGTVKGDLYCGGRTVEITGTIEGDVICAAQTLKLRGKVFGDVRVAGQTVDITSDITGSATVLGETLTLGSEGRVGRDITLAGARVQLDGKVGRDVLGSAESATISGKVGRDMQVEVMTLALTESARVGHGLTYTAQAQAKMEQGSMITGETHYTERIVKPADSMAMKLQNTFYGFVSMFMIGIAAIVMAPRALDGVSRIARTRPGGSFMGGATTLVLIPLLSIVLFITIFGIPLGIALMLVFIAALIGSVTVASYAIGWVIVEKMNWPPRGRRIASLIIGLFAVCAVSLVPVLGGVIFFLIMLCGLGALAMAAMTHMAAPKEKAVKTKVA